MDSTSHLVEAILRRENFKVCFHAATMEHGRAGGVAQKAKVYEEVISRVEEEYSGNLKQSLEHASKYLNP
eukprot:15339549-Ditylum_brightwellii.AAC.1